MGEVLSQAFRFLRASGTDLHEAKASLMDDLLPRVFAGSAQHLAADPDSPTPAASAIGRKDNALLIKASADVSVELALARRVASLG